MVEFQTRYQVEIGHPKSIHITLVGCGGTGSFLALHLARLAYHVGGRFAVMLTFVDPDVVEHKNIGRQNFCPAEVGRPKARCLMERYNRAFGLGIGAHVGPFEKELVVKGIQYHPALRMVVGAVDNAAARRDIHQVVSDYEKGSLWWLDGGNHENSGQVLLGNRVDLKAPQISPLGFCEALPSPGVQHPEILEDPVGPVETPATASCADLVLADVQSLMVNQAVAGWMAAYVYRLLLSRDLDTYATYFDLVAGSARSLAITSNGAFPGK